MMPLHDGSLDGLDVWGRPDDVADDDSYFFKLRGRLNCQQRTVAATLKLTIFANAMRTPRYPSLT
jgi:hypothetical protein